MLFRSNDTATTEIYTVSDTLSLHDALPICCHTPTQEYVVPKSMPIAGPSPLVGAIAASRSLAAADEKGQLGLGFSRLRLEQRRLLLQFSDAEAAPMWWYLYTEFAWSWSPSGIAGERGPTRAQFELYSFCRWGP